MARQIAGAIRWQTAIKPGETPVTSAPTTEVATNLAKVRADLNSHVGSIGNDAHLDVTYTQNGFMTPGIVARMRAIEAKVTALTQRVKARIPIGTIIPWNGSAESVPTGWTLVSDANGRIYRGSGTDAVGASGGDTSYTIAGAALPSHRHYLNNCYVAIPDYEGGEANASKVWPDGRKDLGRRKLDWDNYYGNKVYVSTSVAGSGNSNYQPIAYQQPYIKKLFIQRTSVVG